MSGECVVFGSKDGAGLGRVLVVEDDYLVCEIISETLIEFGLEVSSAGDSENALALLSVAPVPFRLAIIDLRLPGRMNGAELARLIHASGTAVVLMSADHERLDAAQRSDATAVCLPKPFGSGMLLECLQRADIDRGRLGA